MKKEYTILMLLLSLTFCGFAQQQITFSDQSLPTVRSQAAKVQKLYFVYLRADWCLPCQWMEENSFTDAKVINYANRNYLALKLDINEKEGQFYKNKWEAVTIPTVLIFSPQGIELARTETSLDGNQLYQLLQSTNKKWRGNNLNRPNTIDDNSTILDSPRATLSAQVSRPPLSPEKNKKVKKHPPVAFTPPDSQPKRKVFTPRSGDYYTISLGIYTDYQKALEIVKKYDNKYGERVDMIRKGRQFQVISGHFDKQSEATTYLNYLNRNDIMGQVVKEQMLAGNKSN